VTAEAGLQVTEQMHMAGRPLDLDIYERGCHLQVASSQKGKTTAPRIMGTGGEGEPAGRQT